MPNITVHGFTEQGLQICRHYRYGWYIKSERLIPMEEITVHRAAVEAIRGGHLILGVPGGQVFDRTVRQLGSDPDIGEPTGLTAWDAATAFWRNAIGPVEILRLERCWEVGFPDGPGDPVTTHLEQGTGVGHRPENCPHV